MKVLHVNAGLENGGGKNHILSLLSQFDSATAELLVLENGIIAEEATKLGITVHRIEQKSRYDLSILKRMAQFIIEGSFDIVHTHGARANFMFAAIHKKIPSIWVTTVHSDPTLDFMNQGLKGTIFTNLNIASLKKANHLILVSDSLERPLLDLGLKKDNMTIIYNGIQFKTDEVERKSKNEIFTLTCVARLHPIKGHEVLLKSLAAAQFVDFNLHLVGNGELKALLEQLAQELNLQNQIQFHGFLDTNQVETQIAQSDLTILASYNEGFPLVLLESAKQKVPFIATNVGDIKRLLPDESYGWCIPANSVRSLTDALNEAYSAWERNELKAKGEKVYQLASNQFSLFRFYKDTFALYQKLLQ